ncbi:hypothetical protein [Amycolatopsis nigrescens]|uniref:hypothetical protein n=1 Tax=Amycolatopsis nigrescens TaxID=381445 RepID=UPI00035EE7F4|nr:hypothetical protein [Amycolatopsis nigrescens]
MAEETARNDQRHAAQAPVQFSSADDTKDDTTVDVDLAAVTRSPFAASPVRGASAE